MTKSVGESSSPVVCKRPLTPILHSPVLTKRVHFVAEQSFSSELPASFQNLRRDHPQASHFLDLCAYLRPDAIPLIFIEYLPGELLHLLERYHLLGLEAGGTHYILHPKLQLLLQNEHRSQEKQKAYINQTATFLKERLKEFDEDNSLTWTVAKECLIHIEFLRTHPVRSKRVFWELVDPKTQAELYRCSGEWLRVAKNRLDDALHFQESAYMILKNHQPNQETLEIASSLHSLGNIWFSRKKYNQAIDCYEKALKIRRQLQSESEIVTTLNCLGKVFLQMRNIPESERCFHEALEIVGEQFNGSFRHADILNGLGNLRWIQKKYPEAKACYQKALEIHMKRYGENFSLETAFILNNLGHACFRSREYEIAETHFQDALNIRRCHENTPLSDIENSLHGLERVYWALKDTLKAKGCCEKILAIRRELYEDKPHTAVATALNNLGKICESREEYPEAKTYYKTALRMREQLYEGTHPEVASSLNGLGNVYLSLQKYLKAKTKLEAALEMRNQLFKGKPQIEIVKTLIGLGHVLTSLKDYSDAKERYLSALKMQLQMQPTSYLTVMILKNLKRVCAYLGESSIPEKYQELAQELGVEICEKEETLSFVNLCREAQCQLENDLQIPFGNAITHREQALDEELQQIQKVKRIRKGEASNEEIETFIAQENASIDVEIKGMEETLTQFQYWKERLEVDSVSFLKDLEASEKKLEGIEKKTGKLKEGKIPKKQFAHWGKLTKDHGAAVQRQKEHEEQLRQFQIQYDFYLQEMQILKAQQRQLQDQYTTQEEKLNPIYEKYHQKEEIIAEQKKLISCKAVHDFYKTLEKMLGSKFASSILLESKLLQRSSKMGDHVASFAGQVVEGVFGIAAAVISIGTGGVAFMVGAAATAVGIAAGKATEKVISDRVDKKYENRAKEISSVMNHPKYAWMVAELLARRVSQHYFSELQGNDSSQNQEWAIEAANLLYQFIATGKLKERGCETEEEMIETLIGVIQEYIEQARYDEKKKGKDRGCSIL